MLNFLTGIQLASSHPVPAAVGEREADSDLQAAGTIDVCISTLDSGLLTVIDRLPRFEGLRYLVGHQQSGGFDPETVRERWESFCQPRSDVHYIALNGLGLSRSRNDLLQASSAEIVMFSDDDIDYLPGFAEAIASAYAQYPAAAAITFRLESAARRRKYAAKPTAHNALSAMGVTSVGLTIRRSSVVKAGVLFDESFGLGSVNPSGEEFVFVTDLLKAGLEVLAYPAPIARHDHLSSGPTYFRDPRHIRAKGRMFNRVFGNSVGPVMSLLFALKKFPEYRQSVSFWRFCRYVLSDPA